MPRYVKGKKFWSIELKKTKNTIFEGAIGTEGDRSIALSSNAAEAKEYFDAQVAAHVAKGYKLEESTMAAKKTDAGAKQYFENEEDGSSKFWEVWTEGATLKTRFGKIGSSGQIKLKELGSPAAALAEYAKLIAEKTKKGYVAGGGAAAAAPAAPAKKAAKVAKVVEERNADLEANIAADPYDKNNWMALADWYQEQGNPRGELMALQLANKAKPAAALMAKYQDDFLGPLAEHVKCYDSHDPKSAKDAFTWRNGFIFGVRLSHNHYANETFKGKLADVLKLLLDHPSGRFITEMTFQDNDDPNDDDLQDLIDLLAKRAPKTLRRIEIGDEVDQISWYNVGNLGKLWKAVPNLKTLLIEAGSFTLGTIDLPHLKRAIFETGGLSSQSGMSIAKANWPEIEHLEIYYGDDNYGGDCTIKQVAPLLARSDLKHLKYLGLENAMFTDDIAKALPKAAILRGLETLDLSKGCMTDEGALAMAAHKDAFAHLHELIIDENYLTPAGVKALKGICKKVTGGNDQKDDDDPEYRSVSVGE